MDPRIIDLLDDSGNPVYETDASGNQVMDAEGNPKVKTIEAYDRSDVEKFLQEKEELAKKLAKLEEDNRIKDENFRRMRDKEQPSNQVQQPDVSKVVEEEFRKREMVTAQNNAKQTFTQKFAGDQTKIDTAMIIFNKLFDGSSMNLNDAINAASNAVSPQSSHANWAGGGSAGTPQAKPATEDFSKHPDRSYAYKEISSQLDKINHKENLKWRKVN
jgi:hypothetical protein